MTPYELARLELGVKEWTAPGESNPRVEGYFRDVGHPVYKDDTAWCAAFLGAMLERADIRSTRKLTARSYMTWGQPTDNPKPGDIAVFWRNDPASWQGHVGFVVSVSDTNVVVLGGNQRNAVTEASYDRARLLGFRTIAPASAAPAVRKVRATAPDRLEAFLAKVKISEGGYVDHPADRGGATNHGITIGKLREWRGRPVTKQDVKDLTWAEAKEIYRKDYWTSVRADELPYGIDYMMLDMAINHGANGAARILQDALGVTPDGIFGPQTLEAVRQADVRALVGQISDARREYYEGIMRRRPSQEVFRDGWMNRADRVEREALEMIGQGPATPSRPVAAPVAGVAAGGALVAAVATFWNDIVCSLPTWLADLLNLTCGG